MAGVVRFGISLDKELFARFSAMITKRGWKNRSDAFGRLIREELVKEEWASGQECAGAITLIYDHHKRELVNRLMDIQHDFGALILSSQHIHLDHHNCLEVIAVKGTAGLARRLTDALRSVKGIKHATLSMSTTGKDM